jgi:hypothetical protein
MQVLIHFDARKMSWFYPVQKGAKVHKLISFKTKTKRKRNKKYHRYETSGFVTPMTPDMWIMWKSRWIDTRVDKYD